MTNEQLRGFYKPELAKKAAHKPAVSRPDLVAERNRIEVEEFTTDDFEHIVMETQPTKAELLELEAAEIERRMFEETVNRLAGNPHPPIRAIY